MSLQYSDIDDAVISALQDLGRGKFTDNASKLQRYVAFKTLMRGEYVETTQQYGKKWNVLVQDNGSASHVGLYHVDDTTVVDGLKVAQINMKHTVANWQYDLKEIDMNVRDPASRILSLVKVRRAMARISLAGLMETDFWTLPAASDTDAPVGVPYYIVPSASSAGFNGANPVGYSDVAGLDADVYTVWRNWTGRYTDVTVDDLISKMEEAMFKTQWETPADITDYSTGDMVGIYTNWRVYSKLMVIARQQNDRLGRDLVWSSGKVVFRETPVTWVPELDSHTNDPVYGIQWGDFKILVDKDWFLKEDGPKQAPLQNNVRIVYTDVSWNLKCTDRRKQWVIDTSS